MGEGGCWKPPRVGAGEGKKQRGGRLLVRETGGMCQLGSGRVLVESGLCTTPLPPRFRPPKCHDDDDDQTHLVEVGSAPLGGVFACMPIKDCKVTLTLCRFRGVVRMSSSDASEGRVQ